MLSRTPARCANSSAAMCWEVAGPAVAMSTVPGAALAAATGVPEDETHDAGPASTEDDATDRDGGRPD